VDALAVEGTRAAALSEASATGSPRPCGSPTSSAATPSPCPAAAGPPTTSWPTPARPTSTTIVVGKSEPLLAVRTGQRLGGARPRAVPATSACTSSPGEAVEPRSRRRAVATAAPRRRSTPGPTSLLWPSPWGPARAAVVAQPYAGVENADLFLLTAVVGVGGQMGSRAGARRGGGRLARLQFLLPAAGLHAHHRRPDQRRRVPALHPGGRARLEPRRPRERWRHGEPGTRAGDRAAVRLLAQARRLRHPRRRALGHRVPGRGDAEGARRAPPARGQGRDGPGRLPARGHVGRGRRRGRAVGLRQRPPAGRGADTLPGAKRLFLPMRTGRGTDRCHRPRRDGTGPILTPEAAACSMPWPTWPPSPSSG
jgi:two-component system sensor histidine kinase KdpD